MLATPIPDADERRDNASFSAILQALSRPGTVQTLPQPGPDAVALAVIDRECRVFCDDPELQNLLHATGATPVPPELADHAFTGLETAADLAAFDRLSPGCALYPDSGATVIAQARIGTGPLLRLTGPGIRDQTQLRLGGLHPKIWAHRAHLCRYPLGIEMILIDGAQIVALPRSTTVQEV